MRLGNQLRLAVAAWCCLSLVAAQPICWAQQIGTAANNTFQVADVALSPDGGLQGLIVGGEGQPLPGIPVTLNQGDIKVVETFSDQLGQFYVRSVQGGFYEAQIGPQRLNIRLWAAQTAPPTATTGFTCVLGDVERGQCTVDSCTGACGGTCGAGRGGVLGFLTNPWVIGAAVAAAIAIPLALDDDDDAS